MGGLKGAGEGKSRSELVRIQAAIARGEAREVDDRIWRARAEGLADSLQEVWRRGVGFGGLNGLEGFDATRDRATQTEAFNRRFRPWLYEPDEGVTGADIEADLARTQAVWASGGCGTCGCAKGDTCNACPDCQPDLEKRLDAAEREPDSPSPDPAVCGFAIGIACVVLGVTKDRIAGRVRQAGPNFDFAMTIDGRPLDPSEAAKVEQACRAAMGMGGAR